MKKSEAVKKVNGLFVYEYDKVQYKAADYWRILDVNAEKDEGDCEDYALTVAWLLADQSRWNFLKMLFTKKFRICFVNVTIDGVVGGHAVLEHDGQIVDNWKRKWVKQSTYEKDYKKYNWTFVKYYSPLTVVIKLIQGKFWKK
jgi:predicted transglutaminase-like cysteine proteinase